MIPFDGSATVRTYALDELLGTKIRALYQRRKGRDLFGLWYALVNCDCDPGRMVMCFGKYMEHGKGRIRRRDLLANLEEKLLDRDLRRTLPPCSELDSRMIRQWHLNSFLKRLFH
jgi:predicted nucleotidyltransferase component of viral defense system